MSLNIKIMMTIDKLKNLVNELCPRVNARAWGPTDTVTHTRGKNRSVQIFLPLCTQSLGLALVSVFSPSSFVLRLNNSVHFWKKFNLKITQMPVFIDVSVRRARVAIMEIKVLRILRGVTNRT